VARSKWEMFRKRSIGIQETANNFLYDEHRRKTGRFRAERTRRLRWIRYVLEHTSDVYVTDQNKYRFRMYVAVPIIPRRSVEYSENFYVVLTRQKSKKRFNAHEFFTAYHMEDRDVFLRRLGSWRPCAFYPEMLA